MQYLVHLPRLRTNADPGTHVASPTANRGTYWPNCLLSADVTLMMPFTFTAIALSIPYVPKKYSW